MTIGTVSTSAQSMLLISQLNQDNAALNQTQQQVASGLTSTTYGGFGDQTAALESPDATIGSPMAVELVIEGWPNGSDEGFAVRAELTVKPCACAVSCCVPSPNNCVKLIPVEPRSVESLTTFNW